MKTITQGIKLNLKSSFFLITGILLLVLLCIVASLFGFIKMLSLNYLNSGGMQHFDMANIPFTIDYPDKWIAVNNIQGNHGDTEVIASVVLPGRSYPQMYIATRAFPDANFDEVIAWGEQRSRQKENLPSTDSFHDAELRKGLTQQGYAYVCKDISYREISLLKNYQIICREFIFLFNDQGLHVSACAEQKDWPVVEPIFIQMLDSLAWRNGAND
jgi:hypothetical protein